MNVLLVDAFDSFTYNLVQVLEELGARVNVVRHDVIDEAGARALAPDAVVLSPGPGHPTASAGHMAIAASSWEVPVLGVCLGHQALGAASGGRVVHANEPLHGEATLVHHDGRGLFEAIEPAFFVGRYHSLIVAREGLPACWEVTSRSESGEIMSMAHRALPRWGVQFHPESILTPAGPRLVANFLRLARAATT